VIAPTLAIPNVARRSLRGFGTELGGTQASNFFQANQNIRDKMLAPRLSGSCNWFGMEVFQISVK
jgi:hypothetical protein